MKGPVGKQTKVNKKVTREGRNIYPKKKNVSAMNFIILESRILIIDTRTQFQKPKNPSIGDTKLLRELVNSRILGLSNYRLLYLVVVDMFSHTSKMYCCSFFRARGKTCNQWSATTKANCCFRVPLFSHAFGPDRTFRNFRA